MRDDSPTMFAVLCSMCEDAKITVSLVRERSTPEKPAAPLLKIWVKDGRTLCRDSQWCHAGAELEAQAEAITAMLFKEGRIT